VGRSRAPCVIYLADVDAVSDADGLGKIAASLDAVDCTSQTMIVAATTFPDRVDASLTAPGRFTEQVTTPGPTQPPTLGGTGNEYRPKCSDALWLRRIIWLIPLVDKRMGGRNNYVIPR